MMPDFETALMDLIGRYVEDQMATLDEIETALELRLYAVKEEIKGQNDAD